MSVSYGGDSITFADSSTISSGWTGFKNRIINGGMVIDQRNVGASVTPTTTTYSVDRWTMLMSQASKFSVQQKNGVYSSASNYEAGSTPTGFSNSIKITSTSAYTVLSTDYFLFRHMVEGYNVADFNWGTANAQTVTLSFWVKSSLTGSFGLIVAWGGTNANERIYPVLYTVNQANTWEYKTIVIPADTTMAASGFCTDNNRGIQLRFGFGGGADVSATPTGSWQTGNLNVVVGQTNVVSTSGATFYITGVQLEKGSTASSFEYRPYTTELALCQRYYQAIALGPGVAVGFGLTYSTTAAACSFRLVQEMRTTPSVTLPAAGQTSNTMSFLNSSSYPSATGTHSVSQTSTYMFTIYGTGYTGLAGSAQSCWLYYSSGDSTGYIRCDAEL